MADVDLRKTLDHLATLEREVQQVKRDLLQAIAAGPPGKGPSGSLFGSVRGGDVPEELFTEAKRSMFRSPSDT